MPSATVPGVPHRRLVVAIRSSNILLHDLMVYLGSSSNLSETYDGRKF